MVAGSRIEPAEASAAKTLDLARDGLACRLVGAFGFDQSRRRPHRHRLPRFFLGAAAMILGWARSTAISANHECLPEQAYQWSGGKAVYVGGVQFPPVHFAGQRFLPSQANNLYISPHDRLGIKFAMDSLLEGNGFKSLDRGTIPPTPPKRSFLSR